MLKKWLTCRFQACLYNSLFFIFLQTSWYLRWELVEVLRPLKVVSRTFASLLDRILSNRLSTAFEISGLMLADV